MGGKGLSAWCPRREEKTAWEVTDIVSLVGASFLGPVRVAMLKEMAGVRPRHHHQAAVGSAHGLHGRPRGHNAVGRPERKIPWADQQKKKKVQPIFGRKTTRKNEEKRGS